ncbi:MAG: C40 family peptidase, partial [Clostridiales bacterium]|nr:C40 family peptidase [Clostridiales bacterium]
DCSGFTQYCYRQAGVTLPRTAYMQGYMSNRTRLSKGELKRGDLMVFNTVSDNDLADHVGIYLGDGKFIHASSSRGKVVISSLSGYSGFSWGFRLL